MGKDILTICAEVCTIIGTVLAVVERGMRFVQARRVRRASLLVEDIEQG